MNIEQMAWPEVTPLYATVEEAHADFMIAVNDACQEATRNGDKLPPFKVFYKESRALWDIWLRYVAH